MERSCYFCVLTTNAYTGVHPPRDQPGMMRREAFFSSSSTKHPHKYDKYATCTYSRSFCVRCLCTRLMLAIRASASSKQALHSSKHILPAVCMSKTMTTNHHPKRAHPPFAPCERAFFCFLVCPFCVCLCGTFYLLSLPVEINQLTPAVKIDGRRIGDGQAGPMITRLKEAFAEMTNREDLGTPLPTFT